MVAVCMYSLEVVRTIEQTLPFHNFRRSPSFCSVFKKGERAGVVKFYTLFRNRIIREVIKHVACRTSYDILI